MSETRAPRQMRAAKLLAGLVAATSLAFACAGCTPWPDTATGGLAELHSTDSRAVIVLEQRYETLFRNGGERFAASHMVDARNLLNRARRELAASLNEDAELSLLSAALAIERAERDVSKHVPLPTYGRPQS